MPAPISGILTPHMVPLDDAGRIDEAGGRVPLVPGAAEANVAETLRACGHCRDAGAAAVAVGGPFYYKLAARVGEILQSLGVDPARPKAAATLP